jgi:hypothetical protein
MASAKVADRMALRKNQGRTGIQRENARQKEERRKRAQKKSDETSNAARLGGGVAHNGQSLASRMTALVCGSMKSGGGRAW